jgi:hypothetical protein
LFGEVISEVSLSISPADKNWAMRLQTRPSNARSTVSHSYYYFMTNSAGGKLASSNSNRKLQIL